MNKKIIWSVIAVVIIIVAVVVISKNSSSSQSSSQTNANPIKIGAVLSLTGFAAPWGEYAKDGIDLAVKEINSKGGFNGRLVQVIIQDDATDGKQSVSAWNKLVSVDHVQGVIGGVFDFTALSLIPLALNDKIPFISGSNFYIPNSFVLNSQSFVALTDMDKTVQKLKPYLASSSIKKMAVVHYQSAFGNEIAQTLDGVMKDLGRGGAIDDQYPQIGVSDWKTTIIKLKSEGVDGVFLDMVGNDPRVFLAQAKQLGFSPTFMTYNGIQDSFADQSDKSLLNGVVILNWEVTSPAFADMFQKAYGTEATKSSDKYFEAVYVMAKALASVSDPSDAAAYITSHSFDTPNGIISFVADHSVSDVPVQIQVFKDGVETPWK